MENEKIMSVIADKENKIKRGPEITTMKESLIYALTYMKECLERESKYILDWSDWIEDKDSFEYWVSLQENMGEDELIEEMKKIEIKKGLCKNSIDGVISEIEDFITALVNNKCELNIELRIENLTNKVNELVTLRDLYNNHIYYNSPYSDFHNTGFVCIPIYLAVNGARECLHSIKDTIRIFSLDSTPITKYNFLDITLEY